MKSNYEIQEDTIDQLVRRGPPEDRNPHSIQSVSVLAHEIRNPLTNINLAVEELRSMITNDDQKIILDVIERSSARINNLLTDLLTSFAAREVQREKHSLHQLLDKVLFLCKDRIMLKNITITKDYAVQDCKIVLNEPKMKIALTNIIVNAIEAMSRKGGQLKILTRSIADKFTIQIEDNGCGISSQNLKNIFKPYFTTKPGGLGVGLAAANDILRLNHVRVNVKSEVGKGTCFILLFENNYQETDQQGRTNTMFSTLNTNFAGDCSYSYNTKNERGNKIL
jgi:signal transduction histidine kinase